MRLAVVSALILSLIACSPIQVSTDWNPDQAPVMTTWKTYHWEPLPKGGDNRIYNELFNGRLHDAVDRYLAGRGYTKVGDEEAADFALAWQGSVDQKLSVTQVNSYYGYGYGGWYGYGYGGPVGVGTYSDTYIDQYEEGTLIFDIIDGKTNELAWRGLATAELMHYKDPDKRQARLESAVSQVLDNFPP